MFWYILSLASYICKRLLVSILESGKEVEKEVEKTNIESPNAVYIDKDGFQGKKVRTNPGGCCTNKMERKNKLQRSYTFSGGVDGYGQSMAIITSGGDSQGMNAAIRATVRMALYARARAFAVYWGYQGLVDGGDNIKEFTWDDVTGIIHKGGTVTGSARCKDFRTREGRRKAAYNLVKLGITNLVVIGGDGSLTGADVFRIEWKSLLDELVSAGELTEEEIQTHAYLNIVGMVGSIDNDFCGTDMTIGADSALHRILESADAITTTAASHQRAFVLEVMGRNCGYLALMAGISAHADWICIPEWPLKDGWQDTLCENLRMSREAGRLSTVVIVAEGAQDIHGNTITSNEIKELLSSKLNFDTRVTVLGHVQRGGTPSAFDRLLASRLGAEAALCVLESEENSEACVMCLCGQQIIKKPLHECINQCNAVKQAYIDKNFEKVIQLRGRIFQSNFEMYRSLRKVSPPEENVRSGFNFGLLNCGAPACGMNSVNASFVKAALFEGHKVIGIKDGFAGLLENEVRRMKWNEVDDWSSLGGAKLGVSRTTPSKDLEKIKDRFREHQIQALLLVGGFEAFVSLLQLYEARKKYVEFCIPMVLIPATLSNNVPGSWLALGADTALNCIVQSVDCLRQSAGSSQNGLFIVETMGGKCGYLATMAAIASGADCSYIFEEKFGLNELKNNIEHLKNKFENAGLKRGIVLRTEHCNENYSTDFITRLYDEEGKGLFATRKCVLGHIQQGGCPTPFDRLSGTRYGIRAFKFLHQKIEANKNEFDIVNAVGPDSACVLGLIKNQSQFTPISELKDQADFENRLPKECWWMNIRPLLRILAHYQVVYRREDEL